MKKSPTELTDAELLQESKNIKSARIINAALIGFLAGVVIYSIINKTFGFLMLIPLYIIYRLVKKSKYDEKELEDVLRQRNLK